MSNRIHIKLLCTFRSLFRARTYVPGNNEKSKCPATTYRQVGSPLTTVQLPPLSQTPSASWAEQGVVSATAVINIVTICFNAKKSF